MIAEVIRQIVEGVSLTRQEARVAMDEIMEGKATPTQIAALLIGLRMKGEAVPEITGFVESMRSHSVRLTPRVPQLVDTCGTGGDGAHTFNVSTIAAFVAAGAGVPIAKHGNRAISSTCGSADLLEALGVNIQAPPEVTQRAIEEVGIGFMFAPLYHPAMKHAAPVRKELGVRTVFNILGPMTNPAGAKRQVMGVFRKDLTEVIAQVLKNLGTEEAWIVHGEDGLDELSLSAASQVISLRNGTLESFRFQPEEYGFRRCDRAALSGGTPKEAVATTRALLENHEKGPKRDWVILNAAAAILVGGGAKTFSDARGAATTSLESGAAFQKLQALIQATDRVGK